MKSVWIGIAAAASVLYFAVFKEAKSPQIFLNAHAITLVIGGTIGVAFLIFPLSKLNSLVDFILLGFLFRKQKKSINTVFDIVTVAKYFNYRQDLLATFKPSHPFVEDAKKLLVNAELTAAHMEYLLKSSRDGFKKKYSEDARMMMAISKFPPALGLLGASAGMIEMMTGLGNSGVSGIGAAMAVALTATFWGIGLANFMLLPLTDYATQSAQEDLHIRNLIVESMMMVKNNFPIDVIIGQLHGKCTVEEKVLLRNKLKELESQISQGQQQDLEGTSDNVIRTDFNAA